MDKILAPKAAAGSVRVPSSKSMTHRELIASALAKGKSLVTGVTWSDDIDATLSILQSLGATWDVQEGTDGLSISISGNFGKGEKEILCDAHESGSTLRFMIPIGLMAGVKATYVGRGRLVERPLTPYYTLFDEKGISYETKGGLPLTVEGTLSGGKYELPGDISSQFFTGLLFALPMAKEDSILKSTTELESKGYVAMTLDTLSRHGIVVYEKEAGVYEIPGNQTYKAGEFSVEGDYSQAAFHLVSGLIGGEVTLTGLDPHSHQGDKAILSILQEMGGQISVENGKVVAKKSKTHGITIDAKEVPDLVPVLTALASISEGRTEIINATRVRLKECDRLHAMAVELNKLGAKVTEKEDGLVIDGVPSLSGGEVDSWNDHRIAMALSTISFITKEPLTICGAESVNKSYPGYWEDFEKLTGGSGHGK